MCVCVLCIKCVRSPLTLIRTSSEAPSEAVGLEAVYEECAVESWAFVQ